MKNQKGITLIALIITIIVMLILVGVSVSTAINTGLFRTASGVSQNTQRERDNELIMSDSKAHINGLGTTDIDGYVDVLTGKKEKDELMKDNGYTHKMTITVKKDADGDLDKNGTETIGTYTYYIIEDKTTGANLASRYEEFYVKDKKVMFKIKENEEFALISTEDCWIDDLVEPYDDPDRYNLLQENHVVFESVKVGVDGNVKGFNRVLTIGTSSDIAILDDFDIITPYVQGELDDGYRENFDGKCPFIDFTIIEL